MSLLPENHVYSYSQLSSFDECPFSFYLQRMEKVEQVPNAFSEQGSLVHDLIDQWAQGLLTKEDLPEEYKRRYPEEVVTQFPRMLAAKGYAEKTYQQGLYYFEHFDEFKELEILNSEEKMRTEIAGRPFVGVVDLIVRDMLGNLIIIDHKSKSLLSFKKDEAVMYRQQYLYAKFVKEKYGEWPVYLAFNLFKEGGLLMSQRFDMDTYEETLKWAQETIEKIESFDTLDWLQTKEKSDFFCQEICGVRAECVNGRK